MPDRPLTVVEAPDLAALLVQQLRLAADEIDSARRYGVPIPPIVSVFAFNASHPGLSFSATEHEFAAWVEYAEAEVEEYESGGQRWSRATADVNGLRVGFAWGRPIEDASEATA